MHGSFPPDWSRLIRTFTLHTSLIFLVLQTPDRLSPFIDEISTGMFVCLGGCGYAGKSADEIGRVAAKLAAEGIWDSKVPKEAMRARWAEDSG